jgi:hypothetical protein
MFLWKLISLFKNANAKSQKYNQNRGFQDGLRPTSSTKKNKNESLHFEMRCQGIVKELSKGEQKPVVHIEQNKAMAPAPWPGEPPFQGNG